MCPTQLPLLLGPARVPIIPTLWLMPLLFLKIIYLLDALGICCGVWAFSNCSEWGILFVVVCGLLIAAVSPLIAKTEHGL